MPDSFDVAAIFSAPGVAIATALHTFGAIGYLGGVGMYIAWHRGIRRGHDHASTLGLAAAATYVSILANLVGGFIKTYIPGHPKLTAIATEPWVLNMTVKHIVLFAGMFAAIWLIEMEAPRLRRKFKAGELESIPARRSNVLSTIVVISILIAAVQGGASTVMTIGDGVEDIPAAGPTQPTPFEVGPYHFSGQLTSSPNGASDRGDFVVPAGATRIEAQFSGITASPVPLNPSQFTLVLRDPTGASTRGSTDPQMPTGPRTISLVVDDVTPGLWTYDVQADAGVAADWKLDIELTYAPGLEGVVIVPDGTAFTLEVTAAAGGVIEWDWSSTAHVNWALRTEFDGPQTIEQGHFDADRGTHMATDAGSHVFSWDAVEGGVSLTYRVGGDVTFVRAG